jgi:hypothetical protein
MPQTGSVTTSAPPKPWTPPGLWVPPRYATPRDETRRTTGPGVAKIMAALGWPPMPWQVYAATVGGEVSPLGIYARSLIVVSVPRQSGKSALMLGKKVHRCLARPEQKTWFTAQKGKDATDLYRELVARVLRSPLAQYVHGKPAYRGGAECLTFVNGSTLRPFAPGRDALHGKQSDDDDIDEGWAFDPVQGADLFQAITPTHSTRPGAQTWVWSTRGDAASTWFHDLIDAARDNPAMALFDWGIPADLEPTPENVAAHHPAVGHTQTLDGLRAAQTSVRNPAEYARAFGNLATGARELVIPVAAWEAARTLEDLPPGRPAYGVAVSKDGSMGALAAATTDAAGRPVVELLEHRPGRHWLVDAVTSLRDAGQGVAVDRRGPAAPVADALELAGVDLLPLNGMDYAAACQDLWDRLCDDHAEAEGPRLLHRAHPALDAAVNVAARRLLREGGWVWSRAASTGDVSPLEAATLAARAAAHAPVPVVVGRSVFLPG